MATSDSNPMQAIAVKASNHFETITAVAVASGLSLARVITNEPMNQHFRSVILVPDHWQDWLNADYGKSVRHIRRPAEHERLLKHKNRMTPFTVGGATAYAFAPMRRLDYPSALSKLQATGLELHQEPSNTAWTFGLPGDNAPVFAINDTITMSTGKTAAQLAHGLMLWVLKTQHTDKERLLRWVQNPRLAVSYQAMNPAGDPSTTVIDNGHTELAPNTPTVQLLG